MNFVLNELDSQRKAIGAKAQAIVSGALNASRSMTAAENADFENLTAQYDALGKKRDAIVAEITTPSGMRSDAPASREVRALGDKETAVSFVKAHGKEDAGVGFGQFIRAMALGPKTDAERRALSAGTDSAGGYTVPDVLSAEVIDKLRARTVVTRLGARVVPLLSDVHAFARITADATASWKAENASISDSAPTFDRVTFAPKTLVSLVKASRELLEDSVNIQNALETMFINSFAVAVDAAALVGTGASNSPTGIASMTGVNSYSMGTNGAALTTYTPFLQALYEVETDNDSVNGFVMAPRTALAVNGLVDSTGQPLRKPDALASIPFVSTTSIGVADTQGSSSVASKIIAGNFSELWLGVRTSLRVEVLKERYADELAYGFLCYLRMDVQAAHPASFCKIVGVTA